MQQFAVLRIESPDKLLQRELKFSSARQPGAVDAVAGSVNVAAPDTLKTQQNVAAKLRQELFQLIRKPNDGFCAQAR